MSAWITPLQRCASRASRPGSRSRCGAGAGTEGSLAERYGGERWLADGDEVVLRGRAGAIALSEARGRIVVG